MANLNNAAVGQKHAPENGYAAPESTGTAHKAGKKIIPNNSTLDLFGHATPAPTETPAPAATAIPAAPTETPAPTATPAPTPTPATAASPDTPALLTPRDKTLSLFAKLTHACPPPPSLSSQDCITVVVDERNNLGKNFAIRSDGSLAKTAQVTVSSAVACQFHVPTLDHMAAVLTLLGDAPNACLSNSGWTPAKMGQPFVFLSTKTIESAGFARDSITQRDGMPVFARLKEHAVASSWQLLDRDEDAHTPLWARKMDFEQWRTALGKILPGLPDVDALRCPSSSARVCRDGVPVSQGNGHVWLRIADPSDAERTRSAIFARSIVQKIAWKKPHFSKSTGLETAHSLTTIIDASTWTVGRLVFSGQPTISAGLTLNPVQLTVLPGSSTALDTSLATVEILPVQRAALKLGVDVKMHLDGSGYRAAVSNLRLDTEIELANGTLTTTAALMARNSPKTRCQSPFRASTSLAAFFEIDRAGSPFLWDSGTSTKHTLHAHVVPCKPDAQREELIREVSDRLGKLIGEDNAALVFNEAALRMAWDSSFFIPRNNKAGLINRRNEYIELMIGDFETLFRRTFGRVFHDGLLSSILSEIVSQRNLLPKEQTLLEESIANLEVRPLIARLKLYRQASSLAPHIDMFAEQGRMTVADSVATVVLPHKPFAPVRPVSHHHAAPVVADYVLHFPEFFDLLNLILHARFATDRRDAYVWLHAQSSWGKGFLMEIFNRLGLTVEISTQEIESALEGKPVGLSLTDTLRAWILFHDEFKKASSELKQLCNKMTLSPKNQLRCTVPLYTKLFASAESVRSLVGDGVEAQFNNRFAYLSPTTRLAKLDDRPLFQRIGKTAYLDACASFTADFLNAGVTRLVGLGLIESSKIADAHCSSYQNARRLSTVFGTLDTTITDIADEIHNCLVEYARWSTFGGIFSDMPNVVQGIGPRLLASLKRTALVGFVIVGDNGYARRKALILSDPTAFVKSYIALSDDRSVVTKLQFKADDIVAILSERPDTPRLSVYSSQITTDEPTRKVGIVVFCES